MAKPTSAKNWKKRTGGTELELPSGNVCKVKRPGMQFLLSAGMMPDSLTPIAMKHIQRAQSGGKPSEESDAAMENEILQELVNNPDQMAEIFASFDKVVAFCVTEPKVALHFYTEDDENAGKGKKGEIIPDDERDEDVLYTDDVDEEDKQAIFTFVVGGDGGGGSMSKFRGETGADVADPSSS